MNLESVQVGDTLIWKGRHLADSREVTVERLTKTQIVLTNGGKFRKADGRIVGSTVWHSAGVTIPKEGEIEEIQEARLHQRLMYEINGACQIGKLRTLSLEQLKQLNSLLETL